jgi:hypothetical protein
MPRPTLAILCAVAVVAGLSTVPVQAAPSGPRMVQATLLDRDHDGRVDQLVVRFNRPVRVTGTRSASRPLRVAGFHIAKVHGARWSRTITVSLRPRRRSDRSTVRVSLVRASKRTGPVDRAGRPASSATILIAARPVPATRGGK